MFKGEKYQWNVPLAFQPIVQIRVRLEIFQMKTHSVHFLVDDHDLIDAVLLYTLS